MTQTKTIYSRQAGTILVTLWLSLLLQAQPQPNVVFILADNLGYGELGCYGGGILRGAPTPHIDKLAAEGTRFTNMNTEPQCTPSRSSILTGRFAIRSGTYAVPFGGVADGLTQWETTMAESLSANGYTTAYYGKWHLGSQDGRLPTDQGFNEWYGIPRTTDEAMWPGSTGYNEGIMPPEMIMEGKKGSPSKALRVYDLKERRLIDAELTRRSIQFMQQQAKDKKPFFVFTALTQAHIPALCHPAFQGRTRYGEWADMLAELDHNVGRIVNAVDSLGVSSNTIVVFLSDNGPEFVKPWDGWAGPWRGQYFTAWEGGIRVPFILRWKGHITGGRVTNELVHGVDFFPTIAALTGAKVPTDRPIDGLDMSSFFLARTDTSGREGFPIWVDSRLQAVKWRNYKLHFYYQETMVSPPQKLGVPLLFDLFTNPTEDINKPVTSTWIIGPVLKIISTFEESTKKYALIPMGTPDPYKPPNRQRR